MTKETMNTIPDIIIAIDGYSATGKSTLAKLIAAEFGFTYLDSGAMYRAVTLHAMESGFVKGEAINADALLADLTKNGLDINFGEGNRAFIGSRCIE